MSVGPKSVFFYFFAAREERTRNQRVENLSLASIYIDCGLYFQDMNRHERRKLRRSEHKEQHYVAKGYTRAWCDPDKAQHEEPYVWIFDRDGPTTDKPAKRKAPVNIFWEPEMYTITPAAEPDGRDLSLEHALSRLETNFCAVRRDFIEPMRSLGANELGVLLAFLSSSKFRTPGYREHTRSQWEPILEKGRAMENWAKTATPEEKTKFARRGGVRPSGKGMTLDQVQAIVDKPLQTTLMAHTRTTVPLLAKMTHMTIMCTEKTPGFITGDEPTVWFDPEAYKRPPIFQAPALMYKSIEITLPISPTRMMFLGRQNHGWPQYLNLDEFDPDDMILDDLNRRTCRFSREKVVVSRNEFRSIWAEDGELPTDAWRPIENDDVDNFLF